MSANHFHVLHIDDFSTMSSAKIDESIIKLIVVDKDLPSYSLVDPTSVEEDTPKNLERYNKVEELDDRGDNILINVKRDKHHRKLFR
jgi:hypothetical protein